MAEIAESLAGDEAPEDVETEAHNKKGADVESFAVGAGNESIDETKV